MFLLCDKHKFSIKVRGKYGSNPAFFIQHFEKNSKLKEKTQELKKKTQGFSNICRIEKRNTTFFHKNVIFNAYFLPDITKSECFCVKIKLFMFEMVIF